jgi:hypothetical protein
MVEILSRPPSIRRGGLSLARLLLSFSLPSSRLVEQPEAVLDLVWHFVRRQQNPEVVVAWQELNLISWSNTEAVGNRLGHRDLELAGDLGHALL